MHKRPTMKLRLFLLLTCLWHVNSFAQNMQLADLYLTYSGNKTSIVPLDFKTDLIATSWTESDKFYPDHQDFNSYVDNTNDAYVVWQEAQNHNYIKHLQFKGSGSQQIEKLLVSSNQDLFVVLSSTAADTINILSNNKSFQLYQPKQGSENVLYTLIKFNKDGEYQRHLFLGYYDLIYPSSLILFFPNKIDTYIPLAFNCADSTNYIPETTTKIKGSLFAKKTVTFHVSCNDLSISNVKTNNYTFNSVLSFPNAEINYIIEDNGKRVHDSAACIILYNGDLTDFSDSLIASKNTSIRSATSLGDTLYLVQRSSDTVNHKVNGVDFENGRSYITKWINGVLVDSMTTSLYDINFFLDNSDKLYIYGYTVSIDYKPVNISFLKGKPYILKDDQAFRFWGPILNDSLKWMSHIAGNAGPGGSTPYFYADSNAQYLSTNIKSWMDLDPGPYEWQFNPLTYDGKTVIAKYNCYPNAIFTLDQTAQNVQFYNFSSGGQTYKWLFGVGSANSTDLNPIFSYPAIGDYDVTLIAYNDCGSDTFSFPVSIDKMISVENIHVPEVTIYPNPASNNIRINHGLTNGSVTIVGLNGKTLTHQQLENTTCTINVSDFHSGMYIMVLKDELNTITRKLVIE